jgi:hypothetical protein
MSALSKIGNALRDVGSFAAEMMQMPFLAALIKPGSVVASDITKGVDMVGTAATIFSIVEAGITATDGSKTGAQKLAAATPAVAQAFQAWAASNLPGHNKLDVSPEEFSADVQAWCTATVKILNDFK